MARLREVYKAEVAPKLKEKFGYENINQIPKVEKIIVNCVTRDVVQNAKMVESIKKDLGAITGQRAVTARAKKSIASFKVREGQALGAYVTLRGEQMCDFLDKLVNFTLPRVRDFRGVSPKAFDGRGNYTLGIKEQIIFPEISYDNVDKVRGIGVAVVTTAKNNEEGRELLSLLGMPFKK